MRLGTFNVHGWCDARGKKRVDDVIAFLAAADCDVLVLNEVMHAEGPLPRVAAALGMSAGFAPAGYGGNAVLARVPITSVDALVLDRVPGEVRAAVVVRVDGPDGRPLDVVGTHLDHRREAMRLTQLEQLHEALAERLPRRVLAGDLNAMRLSDQSPAERVFMARARDRQGWEPAREDVMARLDGWGYIDAVRLALAGSLDGYTSALGAPITRAHAVTSRVDTRIDYILLSPALARDVVVTRARTVLTDVSDHHLVLVELAAA